MFFFSQGRSSKTGNVMLRTVSLLLQDWSSWSEQVNPVGSMVGGQWALSSGLLCSRPACWRTYTEILYLRLVISSEDRRRYYCLFWPTNCINWFCNFSVQKRLICIFCIWSSSFQIVDKPVDLSFTIRWCTLLTLHFRCVIKTLIMFNTFVFEKGASQFTVVLNITPQFFVLTTEWSHGIEKFWMQKDRFIHFVHTFFYSQAYMYCKFKGLLVAVTIPPVLTGWDLFLKCLQYKGWWGTKSRV